MQGAAARIKREHDARRWAVWHVAWLGRVEAEKFPKFDDFVSTPKRKQTPEEMERALMAWQIAMERAQ